MYKYTGGFNHTDVYRCATVENCVQDVYIDIQAVHVENKQFTMVYKQYTEVNKCYRDLSKCIHLHSDSILLINTK